jgi:hypothetical protein
VCASAALQDGSELTPEAELRPAMVLTPRESTEEPRHRDRSAALAAQLAAVVRAPVCDSAALQDGSELALEAELRPATI